MAAVKKESIYLVVIVVLVITLLYFFSQGSLVAASQGAAVESVRNVYSLLTENPVEVVSVKEESGLFRILLRVTNQAGQQNLQEVFATKDGSLITDRIINTTGYVQQLASEKAFAECLAANNVAVFGIANEPNTLVQLRLLGNFAYKVFGDCSGANLQLCQQAGIQQVPTIVIGNQSAVGVQPLSFFQTATGCAL